MTFLTEKERKKELKTNIENYMKLLFRKSVEEANPQQMFQAVAYAVKDIVVDDWMATHKAYEKKDVKTVYYLSIGLHRFSATCQSCFSHLSAERAYATSR